jgi:hypothetical protein
LILARDDSVRVARADGIRTAQADCVRIARLGALAWLALLAAEAAGAVPWRILEPLFLLAPLVLVPLALGLAGGPAAPLVLRRAVPIAALAAAASLALRVGPFAGALAGLWCALTGWLGFRAARRLLARGLARADARDLGRADAAETAIDLGFLALPVGGAWFTASRLGLEPLGFAEPIVLLTAIHFHFASFAALVWTGCAARRLPATLARRLAVGGVAAGPPLLAAGFVETPWLELAGTLVLAASLGGLAVFVLARVSGTLPAGRLLLRASALSVLVSLALAIAYAWGQAVTPLVSLDLMARAHGTLNALGFGLCGLAGWTRATRAS